MTQIVSCSVDDIDPQAAIDACKAFLTLYLCSSRTSPSTAASSPSWSAG